MSTDKWVPEEPAADLQKAGESMTFAECDDMLDCITRILDEHLLNGATHCHMMRWKFRQVAAAAQQERARHAEDVATVAQFVIGWFPGYEDAVQWGSDGPNGADRSANLVFLAAQRLVAAHQPPTPEDR